MSAAKGIPVLQATPHDAEWHELALVLWHPGETGEHVMCSSCFADMRFEELEDGQVRYTCTASGETGTAKPMRRKMQ
ncbi:MAG TPA: hypothetical protein VNM70_10785 [Burkholderiales bacterium]|nr:hypothetical protein [Burkholderiales bacterium]